jgi:uncharacterized protein DUF4071
MKPLCFVLMPFGRKAGPGGLTIDFDAVYSHLIAPAIEKAELEPVRADEEQAGGIIHKPMFERLVLCEFAVADLTTANANVFYELGLRHAVKPFSTTLIFAANSGALPFDVAPLRGLPYTLGADGKPLRPADDSEALVQRLIGARAGAADSPVFQLLDGFPDIQRLKTDVFRDRVEYSRQMKERLAGARQAGVEKLRAIEQEIAAAPGSWENTEAGVVVDLFLSYRAVSAWADMQRLVGEMTPALAATPLVREQHAFALNRSGDSGQAERILLELIAARGPSSETCGLLGRVYKDRWDRALKRDDTLAARGLLKKAISTYLQGFETDWRDAYPGINAVTLMELSDPPDPRRTRLLPVVAYAVERRIAAGKPDYWDYATLVELAVLAKDEEAAIAALGDALAAVREPWERESTANNLRLIGNARARRGERLAWAGAIEAELRKE